MITPISKQQVVEFLRKNPVLSLATCHENQPHISVLLFVVDDDLTLFFATRENSQKAKILSQNPSVSLAVWSDQEMMVQIDGVTSLIAEPSSIDQILDRLAKTTASLENFWPPILNYNRHDPYAVFQIKPKLVRALNLGSQTIKSSAPLFTQIEL